LIVSKIVIESDDLNVKGAQKVGWHYWSWCQSQVYSAGTFS
jgi:hypothetical protein